MFTFGFLVSPDSHSEDEKLVQIFCRRGPVAFVVLVCEVSHESRQMVMPPFALVPSGHLRVA